MESKYEEHYMKYVRVYEETLKELKVGLQKTKRSEEKGGWLWF